MVLPSGVVLLSWSSWDRLRGPDEAAAIATLAGLIASWRLPPHHAVPDLLPYAPMELSDKGPTVNRSQWSVLRRSPRKAAERALDVLIRSYGAT